MLWSSVLIAKLNVSVVGLYASNGLHVQKQTPARARFDCVCVCVWEYVWNWQTSPLTMTWNGKKNLNYKLVEQQLSVFDIYIWQIVLIDFILYFVSIYIIFSLNVQSSPLYHNQEKTQRPKTTHTENKQWTNYIITAHHLFFFLDAFTAPGAVAWCCPIACSSPFLWIRLCQLCARLLTIDTTKYRTIAPTNSSKHLASTLPDSSARGAWRAPRCRRAFWLLRKDLNGSCALAPSTGMAPSRSTARSISDSLNAMMTNTFWMCILMMALPISVAPKNVQKGTRKWPHVIPARSNSGLGTCVQSRKIP